MFCKVINGIDTSVNDLKKLLLNLGSLTPESIEHLLHVSGFCLPAIRKTRTAVGAKGNGILERELTGADETCVVHIPYPLYVNKYQVPFWLRQQDRYRR